ncbi:uncharacterized protein LOC125046250 isoform X1 [Penaeus chinensis]|uniref:uncharacterized protein LOC125046250 isoform X1 n=1 Tax=Penaeus chinensis TaxID=139456 RepID=UPI001FB68FAA|nr:uncharacterized protein LOC125046250 isoform X1 [Penaeus chinensis]
MGWLKKDMMKELLKGFLGYAPTEQQIAGFNSIVKIGNSEHLCLGDVAMPLKSPAVKYMENMTTALGHYIRDRNEESHSTALKSLQEIKFPVSKIWIDKDILYVKFEREKLMKCILKEVTKNGFNYGKSKLLSLVKINIAESASRESSAPATSYRGHKLAFHVGEILKHAGAAVELQEWDESKPRGKKRQNSPAPILSEQKKDGKGTYKCPGHCPPCAPTIEPSTSAAGGEFERLVARGMPKPEREKKKPQKGMLKEMLDILDPSVSFQPPKGHKKGLIEEIADACKDIKDNIKSSKEPKTETTSYTIENVTEESYPSLPDDKIFKKYCRFNMMSHTGERKMQPLFIPKKVIANPVTPTEEEDNEISLCIAREPLPTTMISKANQYLFAPVVHMKTNKVWDGSAEDLCKILVEELKRAAMQKHGDIDTPEWSQFLEEQAWRCMSLQMLGVSHCSPLKVEVDGVTQNSRESAFILYNYARLCTIFQSFEESVSEGEIPPLPDIEEIDFALLRNDEEWQLVWGYIFHFPDIIEENAVEILKGSGKFRTVAVAKFLGSFSHRVSEYYSRYHVLSEPLPHLLPTIYARLHLLQAVKTVMEICFATLGVESPTSFM